MGTYLSLSSLTTRDTRKLGSVKFWDTKCDVDQIQLATSSEKKLLFVESHAVRVASGLNLTSEYPSQWSGWQYCIP
jgi:hypothetical protein